MASESAADRRAFVVEFGVEVHLTPKGGERRTILAIYDDAHATFDPNRWPGSEYQMQSGAKFSSSGPRIEAPTVDLKGVRRGTRVEVPESDITPGGDFTVQDVRPDGTGFTVLILIEREP